MKEEITLKSPGKINLHLEVGQKRPDGFHSIASIVQAVDLHDIIHLETLESGAGIELECDCDCREEDNTMYRAAMLFKGKMHEKGLEMPGLRIVAEKNLPSGAGLGGASSNAATVLSGLKLLLPGSLGGQELLDIAARVGSDVPFFMGEPAQRMSGRGEILSPVRPMPPYPILLVKPGFSVSTAWAYNALDSSRNSSPSDEELGKRLDEAIKTFSLEPGNWDFRNDFYPLIKKEWPELEEIKNSLDSSGALFSSMTGSGTCVFAIFSTQNDAIKAKNHLQKPGFNINLCFSLASSPYAV